MKHCRLKATGSLGRCNERGCLTCSWWQTEEEIAKALKYREQFNNRTTYKYRRSGRG